MCKMLDNPSGFINLKRKAKKLIPIISKYEIEDLIIASFTINSWANNRSAMENCLALNYAIKKCDKFSNKTIKNYSEFKDFFETISKKLDMKYADEVVNDFGEIKLLFNNKYYSVLTGTGHSASVYASLQFLPQLSLTLHKNSLTSNLLNYIDTMINALKHNNAKNEFIPLSYELPSKDYFDSVKKYILSNPINNVDSKIISLYSDNDIPEKLHFVSKEDIIYPLFNPSLAIDYYHYLLSKIDNSQLTKVIDETLIKYTNLIFSQSDIQIIKNFKLLNGNIPFKNKFSGFTCILKNEILLFVNEDSFLDFDYDKFENHLLYILKRNQLSIADLDKKVKAHYYQAYKLSPSLKLKIVNYNNYTNIDENRLVLLEDKQKYTFSANELMFMLCTASSLNEISDFIDYDRQDESISFSFGGIADKYTIWKESFGYIEKGAIKFNHQSFGFESAASYIKEQYEQFDAVFPFDRYYEFLNLPECWNIIVDDNNNFHLQPKSLDKMDKGIFKLKNGLTIIVSYNLFELLKALDTGELKITIDFISGFIDRFIMNYSDELENIKSLSNKVVYFICNSINKSSNKYVETKLTIKQDAYTVYFYVNSKQFMDDISNCDDRKIETIFIKELYSKLISLFPLEFESLIKSLNNDINKKKSADSNKIVLDHYYNLNGITIPDDKSSKLFADKEMAKVLMEKGIVPNTYYNKDATKTIRTVQEELVNYVENYIKSFDKINLHIELLKYYASELFSHRVNSNAINLTSDIDSVQKQESRKKLFYTLETNNTKLATIRYLIETNLFLSDDRCIGKADTNKLLKLIAYAEKLVHIQNISDFCNYVETNTALHILDDYRLEIELDESYAKKYHNTRNRHYLSSPLFFNEAIEEDTYIVSIKDAFASDMGFSFDEFCSVIDFIANINFYSNDEDCKEIAYNVFKIKKQLFIDKCYEDGEEKFDKKTIEKVLNYLTINEAKLKTLANKEYPILPIWDREKRVDGFNNKPIVFVEDYYILSPIVVDAVLKRWLDGIFQFDLPYEYTLDNIKNAVEKLKSYYESVFSDKVKQLFDECGFKYSKSDIDLRKEDRKGNHPLLHELGDYDVIGLDTDKKIIYIIECKVLKPNGSVFEQTREQKRFFKEKKYDERFQKRINYFSKIYKSFFKNKGIDISNDDFEIRSYMVVNKVFCSYFKDINFEIITFDELKDIIEHV